MKPSAPRTIASLKELRQAFDADFARLPVPGAEPHVGLLAIRVRGDPYALRLEQMRSLQTCDRLVPVPSRVPELLGLAGLGGAVLPVFSLAALLGYGLDGTEGRWLAVCGAGEPIALAFEHLEGTLALAASELHPVEDQAMRLHLDRLVRTDGVVRPLLDLTSVAAAIERRGARAPVARSDEG